MKALQAGTGSTTQLLKVLDRVLDIPVCRGRQTGCTYFVLSPFVRFMRGFTARASIEVALFGQVILPEGAAQLGNQPKNCSGVGYEPSGARGAPEVSELLP